MPNSASGMWEIYDLSRRINALKSANFKKSIFNLSRHNICKAECMAITIIKLIIWNGCEHEYGVYTIYGISILIFIYWYPIYVSYIVTGNRFLNTDRFKYSNIANFDSLSVRTQLIPFPNAPLIPNGWQISMLCPCQMPVQISLSYQLLHIFTHSSRRFGPKEWPIGMVVVRRRSEAASAGGCDKRELNNFTLLAIIGSDWRCRLPCGYDLVYANELAAYNWPKGAKTRCQDEGAADVATRFRFDSFGFWPDSWLVGLLAALAARCVSGVE